MRTIHVFVVRERSTGFPAKKFRSDKKETKTLSSGSCSISTFATFHFLNVYFRIFFHPDGFHEDRSAVPPLKHAGFQGRIFEMIYVGSPY